MTNARKAAGLTPPTGSDAKPVLGNELLGGATTMTPDGDFKVPKSRMPRGASGGIVIKPGFVGSKPGRVKK